MPADRTASPTIASVSIRGGLARAATTNVYAIKRCMAGVAEWKYGLGSAESLGLAGHSRSDITNPAWWLAKGKKSPAAKKIIAEPKSKKGTGASKSGIQKSGGARRSSRLVAK